MLVYRAAIVAAGLCGAVGVMAAAGASHGGESRNLSAIALVALSHAPTLLALGLAARGRIFAVATALLGLGVLVFIADLGWREWQGMALFAGAAPLGGGAMILGWFALAAAGLVHRRTES